MEFNQCETYKRVHFAVMAIEASALKAHITGKEMHDRLKKQGLIHQRLFRHYEQLHTQSLDWVSDDTVETLRNWEKEGMEENK
jgi:sensor domain CHASE-containing protein